MILAIDPGRSKFGWALGTDKGEASLCGITPTERFREFVDIVWNEKWDLLKDWVTEKADVPILKKPVTVILGKGTGNALFAEVLDEKGISYVLVDEKFSTLGARDLFWDFHPPRGFKALVPKSLRVPPRDIDDLSALLLLRKWVESLKDGAET